MAHIEGALPSGGDAVNLSGWNTVLDLDFTTQTPQTLSSDGNYTIGGLTWEKRNTAYEAAAMNISASGLEIIPSSSSSHMYNGDHTSPMLVIPLTTICGASLAWTDHLRIWVYKSYDNNSANWDCTFFGVLKEYGSDPIAFGTSLQHGYNGPGGGDYRGVWGHTRADSVNVNAGQPTQNNCNSYNVQVYEIQGILEMHMHVYGGVYSSGWPSLASMVYEGWNRPSVIGEAAGLLSRAPDMTKWLLHLGAQRGGSGTDYRPRIGRVRVDVRR